MEELLKEDFQMLADSEFKLLANTRVAKCNKAGIAKMPYNGDGFATSEDRIVGYKTLKKHGFIEFDDKNIVRGEILNIQHITLLVKC